MLLLSFNLYFFDVLAANLQFKYERGFCQTRKKLYYGHIFIPMQYGLVNICIIDLLACLFHKMPCCLLTTLAHIAYYWMKMIDIDYTLIEESSYHFGFEANIYSYIYLEWHDWLSFSWICNFRRGGGANRAKTSDN